MTLKESPLPIEALDAVLYLPGYRRDSDYLVSKAYATKSLYGSERGLLITLHWSTEEVKGWLRRERSAVVHCLEGKVFLIKAPS